ncbi:hypothetical protein HK105_207044 [Polyrhizophydium stewartii]|uniref:Sugar transporter SWEET n=1 Tax=Polyrhizophydium stewartii TaxID=2732419 RepID=A0ABR4N1M8_9FUNG
MTPLEVVTTLLTISMFLTSLEPLRQIAAARTTGNSSVVPFVSTLLNCSLWLKYGLLLEQPAMVVVNTVGVVVAASGLYVFCRFSDPRAKAETSVVYALSFLYAVFIYAAVGPADSVLTHFGLLTATFSILMFGSPLFSLVGPGGAAFEEVSLVVRLKSTAGIISPPNAVISLAVCLLWTAVGFDLGNSFVIVPNAVGTALCMAQLALLAMYSGRAAPYVHTVLPMSSRGF